MNQLFAPGSIERQRHSGYRSSVHAVAEIVDNAIDAGADEVIILLLEETVMLGNRSRERLVEIAVIDNGSGMDETLLNKCLTFAEGDVSGGARIGKFGYGLPNSTVAVCRRGDVISRKEGGEWHRVYLDIDEIINSGEARFPRATRLDGSPTIHQSVSIPEFGTIVTWKNLDKCDAARAGTLSRRIERLLGRVYRYYLDDGLKIRVVQANKSNLEATKSTVIGAYDPLFLTEKRCGWTDELWDIALDSSGRYQNIDQVVDPYFNASTHYARLIDGLDERSGQMSLFLPCPGYFDEKRVVFLGDCRCEYTIKASYARSEITNPGRRSGGQVGLGQTHIRKKMEGDAQVPSGNVFFIRSKREIDYGSFGLYNTTENKNRFWTVEIHFDSDLDELLGVSNTKQSVEYRAISVETETDLSADLTVGEQREVLWADITRNIQACIKKMSGFHEDFARDYRREENSRIQNRENPRPIPEPEGRVIRALPRGHDWNEEQILAVANQIQLFYPSLDADSVKAQIETAVSGLTSTLVLYAPNETGNLFDINLISGKSVTLFNTRHPFYEKVLAPLKSEPKLSIFTVVIEMLISAFAVKQDRLTSEFPDMKDNIKQYIEESSSLLKTFITRGEVEVLPGDIAEHFSNSEGVSEY
jgi:hypothetical protein